MMRAGSVLTKPQYVFRPRQLLRRCAYRPDRWAPAHTTVAVLPWGSPLECWPADAIGSAILRNGLYDLLTTEALFRLTDPGDVAVDIGANVGHMTSALARAAGPSGLVHALEPHPIVREVLERNIGRWVARDGMARIQVHGVAASDDGALVTLVSGEQFEANRGTSHVEPGVPTGTGNRQTVEAVRLDQLVDSAIGVLKLDCEGHEEAALAGASALLEHGLVRDVVFEDFGSYPTAVTNLLEAAGMQVVVLSQNLAGPQILEPRAVARRGWEPPVLVASREPARLVQRLRARGWRALRRVASRRH